MAEVASAFVSLIPSARGFGKATEAQIGPGLRSSGSRLGGVLSKGLKVGLLAGIAGVGVAFAAGLKGAAEYQKILVQTDTVIKSTGGAARVTAKHVADLGNKVEGYSAFSNEAVQSGENLLLTFTNVRNGIGKGNKVFDQATVAATDMATALGGDVRSNALLLGKALNDPAKGYSRLQRSGVSFTAGQIKQIKALQASGKSLKAQKIILREVQKEFGGSAKAAGGTFAGSLTRVKNKIGDVLRDAVMPLLPQLTKFATYLEKKIPAGAAHLQSGLERVKDVVKGLISGFKDGTGAGGALKTVFTGIKSTLTTVGPPLLAFGKSLASSKTAILAIVGAYVAYRVAAIAYNLVQIISLALLKAHTVGTLEYAVVSKVAAAATKVMAAGQFLLNAALDANPIGVLVLLLAGLVVGLTYAYKHSEAFRKIVDGAFHGVVAAGKFMLGALKAYFRFIIGAFLSLASVIIHGAARAFSWVPGIGPKLKAAAAHFDEFKNRANRALAGIHDKQVNITFATHVKGPAANQQIKNLQGRGFANGTNYAPGGVALVGERGPELVNLPRGAQVIPNHRLSEAGTGGSAVFHIYDTDRKLIGTMQGVADSRVSGHARLGREKVRAR